MLSQTGFKRKVSTRATVHGEVEGALRAHNEPRKIKCKDARYQFSEREVQRISINTAFDISIRLLCSALKRVATSLLRPTYHFDLHRFEAAEGSQREFTAVPACSQSTARFLSLEAAGLFGAIASAVNPLESAYRIFAVKKPFTGLDIGKPHPALARAKIRRKGN